MFSKGTISLNIFHTDQVSFFPPKLMDNFNLILSQHSLMHAEISIMQHCCRKAIRTSGIFPPTINALS